MALFYLWWKFCIANMYIVFFHRQNTLCIYTEGVLYDCFESEFVMRYDFVCSWLIFWVRMTTTVQAVSKDSALKGLMSRCFNTFSVDKVCFLECDVGQTEFTPSGCVSLNVVTEPLLGKLMHYNIGVLS